MQQRNVWAAESSLRELGTPSLEDALSYLALLAEQRPEKLERAAVRWHGRLETEATFLSLAESQLALAALASLCAGERDAVEVLRRLWASCSRRAFSPTRSYEPNYVTRHTSTRKDPRPGFSRGACPPAELFGRSPS
jgi:hypothetical protein